MKNTAFGINHLDYRISQKSKYIKIKRKLGLTVPTYMTDVQHALYVLLIKPNFS